MEVISEYVNNQQHWDRIIVIGMLMAIVFSCLVALIFVLKEREYVFISSLVLLICIGFLISSSIKLSSLLEEGPDTHFRVLIEDYSKVYEEGYEIVDNVGNVYTVIESE